MFQWFFDVRDSLKGRLPLKKFRSKCVQVYSGWLKQQFELIPEKRYQKFSKHWI